VVIHFDQKSEELPAEVRGKLFFHYHHFCAALGCKYAPKDEILELIKKKNELINFFPLLSKGNIATQFVHFKAIHLNYFNELKLVVHKVKVFDLLNSEIFNDYSKIQEGIAYLYAEVLNGKRHTGSMHDIIQGNLNQYLKVTSIGNMFDGPLLIENAENGRAFICSSISSNLNQKLIKENILIEKFNVNLT
jgi:hypothetical protein